MEARSRASTRSPHATHGTIAMDQRASPPPAFLALALPGGAPRGGQRLARRRHDGRLREELTPSRELGVVDLVDFDANGARIAIARRYLRRALLRHHVDRDDDAGLT